MNIEIVSYWFFLFSPLILLFLSLFPLFLPNSCCISLIFPLNYYYNLFPNLFYITRTSHLQLFDNKCREQHQYSVIIKPKRNNNKITLLKLLVYINPKHKRAGEEPGTGSPLLSNNLSSATTPESSSDVGFTMWQTKGVKVKQRIDR